MNNGYVAVDELIQQLYDETQKATAGNTTTETEVPVPHSEPENKSTTELENTPAYISTEDMNEFLVAYILPQYVTLQGNLHDATEYDSDESTDWCYKLAGQVGTDSYEAMVYPFQLGKGNEITDLWVAYLYWNGELVEQNDYAERINYSPKRYW